MLPPEVLGEGPPSLSQLLVKLAVLGVPGLVESSLQPLVCHTAVSSVSLSSLF